MNTRKLFYEDCHLSRFSAMVLSCQKTEEGFAIVLDATAFYPEGGGQAADTGKLGDVRVLDTREQGEKIVHFCDGPLEVGTLVQGEIDYDLRFVRMQQHSGEHIVSGIIHGQFGYHNTGFHMSSDRVVIDFDGVIPLEAMAEIEVEANEAIWQNVRLHIWTPEPEELEKVSYRSKRALPWPVRIVEIPGYDVCACCGTHVAAAGEIGVIKLISAVPFRGGTRIEMACGKPAFELMNAVFEQNRGVSRLFSAQITRTEEAARQVRDQLAAQKYRIVELERQIFASIAEEYENAGNVLRFEEGLDSTGVRELADAIAEKCGGMAAVFSGEAGNYSFCLVTRRGDLRQFGKTMVTALHGRGGGKPTFQQGSVKAEKEAIQAFFCGNGELKGLDLRCKREL